MKQIIILALFLISVSLSAQTISLPKPQTKGGIGIMDALRNRKTSRNFSAKELDKQKISNLLWSANGINRTDVSKRTAPSASNCQEIEIFTFTKEGIYLYDAKKNSLILRKKGDYRKQVGAQPFMTKAPVILVFASDLDKMKKYDSDHQKFYSATDVGFVSQNVYLYCASVNLATVVCGSIDYKVLNELIGMKNGKVLLAQPVGYME